jgi:hypothetical protein
MLVVPHCCNLMKKKKKKEANWLQVLLLEVRHFFFFFFFFYLFQSVVKPKILYGINPKKKKLKKKTREKKKSLKRPKLPTLFWPFVGPLLTFCLCSIVSNPGPFQSIVDCHIWSIVDPLFVIWHLWHCFKLIPISTLSWLLCKAHTWHIICNLAYVVLF